MKAIKKDTKQDEEAEARRLKIQKMLEGLPSISKEKVESNRQKIADGCA